MKAVPSHAFSEAFEEQIGLGIRRQPSDDVHSSGLLGMRSCGDKCAGESSDKGSSIHSLIGVWI